MNPRANPDRAPKPPVLAAAGVAMGYDGHPVLEGIDISIAAGECVLLRGGNGAGKTTLVRGLAGLATLAAGIVRVNGVDRREDAVAACRGTVHLGHRDALAAELTVRESLDLWAGSRGLSPAAGDLDAAVDALGLSAMAGTPVRALSAGQKRRAAMLRLALMTVLERTGETPLWLLDEPATALDAPSVDRFAGLVGKHLAKGGAALVTSHQELPIGKARKIELADLNRKAGGNG